MNLSHIIVLQILCLICNSDLQLKGQEKTAGCGCSKHDERLPLAKKYRNLYLSMVVSAGWREPCFKQLGPERKCAVKINFVLLSFSLSIGNCNFCSLKKKVILVGFIFIKMGDFNGTVIQRRCRRYLNYHPCTRHASRWQI